MGTVVVNYVITPFITPLISHHLILRKNVYCTIFLWVLFPEFSLSHSQLSLSLFQVFLVSWSQIFFVIVFTETPSCNMYVCMYVCVHVMLYECMYVPSLLLLYCNMYMDVFFFLFHALQQLFLFEKTHTVSYAPFMSSPCIFDFPFAFPFSFSFLSFGDRFGYKFRRKASVFFTSRQSKS